MRAILVGLTWAALGLAGTAYGQSAAICANPDNRSWVQGDGECLHVRTFTREVKDSAPVLMIFLHGDRSGGGTVGSQLNYPQQFMAPSIAAVAVLRPGYPSDGGQRSSGADVREDHYTAHNIGAVAGALKRLKEFHKARKLVLVGYSGGAATTAVILGKFPGLADAAVLIACPCDVGQWRANRGRAWNKSLSPIDFVSSVPTTARVLALTGNRDTNTDEKLAQTYVAKLKGRGVEAEHRTIANANHDSILNRAETIAAVTEMLSSVAAVETVKQ